LTLTSASSTIRIWELKDTSNREDQSLHFRSKPGWPSTASPRDEVYSRRNPQTGNLIRSHSSDTWEDIFKALDEAEFFDDFLEDREQTPPKEPELL
jgi:hypothetical protein